MTSAATVYSRARQLLHERFGYDDFRPGQQAVIEALGEGKNVLAVMPTGSGKSLCYQLPALLQEGCALVISPLIALMKDQVDALQQQGIAATFINSSLPPREQMERLRACRTGKYKLLYVAPERFRSPRFTEVIAQTQVSLFAVDEAHCISTWGHDFRPDYLRLQQAVAALNTPQVLALTATATVEVQQDIVQQLGCNDMQRFVSGFDRPNLVYQVRAVHGQAAKYTTLGDILNTQQDGSAIIYATTRRAVEEIASFLQDRGIEALRYHAGLSDAERQRTQEAFMVQARGLIVATNAFGMGVDKPDVRCVVHFNLPRSMEAYYQEAGRAGRDGQAAQCVLLFSYSDVRIQEFLLEQSYPTPELLEDVFRRLVALSQQRSEVPLAALRSPSRRSNNEMQLAACVKLLENAGYVERLTAYEGFNDFSYGESMTLVRLTPEAGASPQLRLDWPTLQRREQHERQKLRRMIGYANAQQCRRQKILGYFGERWEQPSCASCDNCLGDSTVHAHAALPTRFPSEAEWLIIQKILSCVARMRGRYGRAKVLQVLMGSQAKEIRDSHLIHLSTHGILKGMARSSIETYLDALLAAACIQSVDEEFPKLSMTTLGEAVMRRQQTLQLALPGASHGVPAPRTTALARAQRSGSPQGSLPTTVPSISPAVVAASPPSPATPRPSSVAAAPVSPPELAYDEALFERLRTQRTALAREHSLPPYCIFNDRTLRAMASMAPTTHDDLLQIYGVGAAKVNKYGDVFLELIRTYQAE